MEAWDLAPLRRTTEVLLTPADRLLLRWPSSDSVTSPTDARAQRPSLEGATSIAASTRSSGGGGSSGQGGPPPSGPRASSEETPALPYGVVLPGSGAAGASDRAAAAAAAAVPASRLPAEYEDVRCR